MKDNLFIKILLIIIVILLALNILLPTLSNPPTSYAAKNIEYKVIDVYTQLMALGSCSDEYNKDRLAGLTEKLFNDFAKEGWEYIDSVNHDELAIFKR